MATNPQARVLELLKRFNSGSVVSIEALQNDPMWFGKSEKTIRRDLDVIKEYFPESFELIRGGKGEKGSYKAITKEVFSNFLDKDTLTLMVQTFNIAQRNNLLNSLDISSADKKIIDAKIKKAKDCYGFITKPYETKKSDVKLLQEIESAIHYKCYTTVTYEVNGETTTYSVKPYKIVFMNENFYLACENTSEEFLFTNFRLANIQKIETQAKTFHLNPDIEEFIKNMQTPWSKYTPEFRKHTVEVIVEVSSAKARFFKAKKFLPSQQVVETKEDGTLVLSFKVTQEMEMEELVKKWLPHVVVIEPLTLIEKIENEIKEYLVLLGDR
ncbi:WYL domain-containing protein [Sulfurimonas sp. SAG-AH-194-I05]|nr:WYL domain-containing protein [Sulfurimonas sp. SAG-AH-194-I05]MDF1875976.1 WYL domain-containing protein [Sulfurimonas sp. SAG-AH-194-I05]